MRGLGEEEWGNRQEWRGLFSGIIDKINALAFIPFIRMKASIQSLFPLFPLHQSVCRPHSQWVSFPLLEPLAQEALLKSTGGVKLTSPLENKTIQHRFMCVAASKL